MAQIDLSSANNKTPEDGKEGSPMKQRTKTLRGSRACLLKVVSYFAGDMQPFGKWMESMSTL